MEKLAEFLTKYRPYLVKSKLIHESILPHNILLAKDPQVTKVI